MSLKLRSERLDKIQHGVYRATSHSDKDKGSVLLYRIRTYNIASKHVHCSSREEDSQVEEHEVLIVAHVSPEPVEGGLLLTVSAESGPGLGQDGVVQPVPLPVRRQHQEHALPTTAQTLQTLDTCTQTRTHMYSTEKHTT